MSIFFASDVKFVPSLIVRRTRMKIMNAQGRNVLTDPWLGNGGAGMQDVVWIDSLTLVGKASA